MMLICSFWSDSVWQNISVNTSVILSEYLWQMQHISRIVLHSQWKIAFSLLGFKFQISAQLLSLIKFNKLKFRNTQQPPPPPTFYQTSELSDIKQVSSSQEIYFQSKRTSRSRMKNINPAFLLHSLRPCATEPWSLRMDNGFVIFICNGEEKNQATMVL